MAGLALDALLVARAQGGDRAALDRLLRQLQAPLFAHVRAIVRDDDLAADVLQETLFTIARRLPSLRDPRWARAWAYRVATREAVRRARLERRWTASLHEDPAALPDAAPEAAEPSFDPELVARLPALLDRLSPASLVVVRLHYLDGLTYGEIAEALDLAVGTVKSRVAYGLAAMRRAMAGQSGVGTARKQETGSRGGEQG